MEVRIIPDPQQRLRAGDVVGAVKAFRQHWRNRIAADEFVRCFAVALGRPDWQPKSNVEPIPWLEYG